MGLSFDEQGFRRFLLIRQGLAVATVKETIRKLGQARSEGLEPRLLLGSVEDAKDHTEAFLAAFLAEHSVFAYNQQVKMANHLLAYAGHEYVRFRKRPEPPSYPKLLSPHEVSRLVRYRHRDAYTNRARGALIALALASGMRRGELQRANVSDIDFGRQWIHIPKPSKRGMVRFVQLPPWLFHPNRPFMAYMRHRQAPGNDGDALLTVKDRHGVRRPTVDYLGRVFDDITAAVGFRVNATRTRHTLATALLNAGCRKEVVQLVLGHASQRSTEVYAKLNPELAAEELRLIYGSRKKRPATIWRRRHVRDPYRRHPSDEA